MFGGIALNEFDQALKDFIEETVKKAVDERTAKIVEETVKKAVAKYALENNEQITLLWTAFGVLASVLIAHRFPSTEEMRMILSKAFEEKAAELKKRNFGEKSEKPES